MNLFHQGLARQTDDSKIVAVAMAKPGIVLRRPVGTNELFREHARLPTAESLNATPRSGKAQPKKAAAPKIQQIDERAQRRAAAAFEKEQQRREKQRQKEKDAAAKAHARRKAAMEKAESALQDAKREHEEKAAAIEEEMEALQSRATAEEERWQKLKERFETALRKAGH